MYREKYAIILLSMVLVGLWQTFYLFLKTTLDRSMIGYGFFGLLVYFFSLHYRPLRLLDRMLSNIASEMPEAMFVYDPTGKCVWINEHAVRLTGVEASELENVNPTLTRMFGNLEYSNDDVTFCRELGEGGDRRYYTVIKRVVYDEKNRISGTVIRIRDETEEKLKIKQELFNFVY